jgi:hypothetical protein
MATESPEFARPTVWRPPVSGQKSPYGFASYDTRKPVSADGAICGAALGAGTATAAETPGDAGGE